LADATIRLLNDTPLRERLTTYAYTHVQETYERTVIAQQAVDFYQTMIQSWQSDT
jgi:glycosyltransferase involved in cell wall biosynthesis